MMRLRLELAGYLRRKTGLQCRREGDAFGTVVGKRETERAGEVDRG